MFFDTLLPALVLTACAVLLLRMVLPAPARQRLDAAGHALWRLLRHAPAAWLTRRRQTRAQREAREAIERARRSLRQGQPRPRRRQGDRPDATPQGGAEVHDLAQHRRRRRDAADGAPPGTDDDPPPPSRPTLH
jgi:hypothetical protein